MNNQKKFPSELLQATIDIRLAYFNDVIVIHPALKVALNELDEMASGLLDQRLVLLLGAAGVGKSELVKLFILRRINHRIEEMKADPQRIPGVFVELEAPLKGSFTFVPFLKEALASLCSVFPGKTLGSIDRLAGKSVIHSVHIEAAGRKPSPEDLNMHFREVLIQRTVEICVLDEVINAFKAAASKSEAERDRFIVDQANLIKTMVNKSQTTFILVGAFDFYSLTVGTAQLARRTQIVHLKPYSTSAEDLTGFLTAVTELLAHLPIEHEIDAAVHATEVFLQCLGCIGNLKNILKSALRKALMRGTTLTITLVRLSYFSAPALLKMKEDQIRGVADLQHFLSLEDLASDFEDRLDAFPAINLRPQPKRLKPGETKPSHRRQAPGGSH